MIKLQQLVHALALARYGNFHRAAQAQNLSQPALSRSIQGLEEALGVALFDRLGTRVAPTLFGEALLRRAASIVQETEELGREIDRLRGGEAARLAVAMGAHAAELSGRRAVAEMARRHPGLSFQVVVARCGEVARLVLDRVVDIGLAECAPAGDDERLRVQPVEPHDVVLCCRPGHPLLGRGAVSDLLIGDYPLVSGALPAGLGSAVPRSPRDDGTGRQPVADIDINDNQAARALVQASDAIAGFTPLQIESDLSAGRLCVLPYRDPALRLEYGFIGLHNRVPSPVVEQFMSLVRELELDLAARNRALMVRLFTASS